MTGSPIRGLATVALLKVNYDANVDHLDLYMPFALDTLAAWEADAFFPEDLAAAISERHGLNIPVDAVRTLLARVRKKGHLRREHGRFFRNPDNPIDLDLIPQRQAIEREHAAVAKRFIAFARTHRLDVADDEHALNLILAFLEANDVAVLTELRPQQPPIPADTSSDRERRIVALFIGDILKSEPSLADYIQRMIEGLVLQNALLLRDINLAKRQFKDLEVFFDTAFLFRAVGLASTPYVTAARDALALLRDANARTSVFTKTIEEMQRVLAAVEHLIATSTGLRQLRPTELSRFLTSRHYSPSDIVHVSALLEKNLRQLGLTIRDLPSRIPKYTLDEAKLAKSLMRADQTDIDARIDHDVSIVAGVLTFRAGRIANSLDDARAIFATTTSLVVRNVTIWYREQDVGGAPPVIHQIGLSNLAWLKNPGRSATQLKRHELVALCAAALRPTAKMWKRFTDELDQLKKSGTLTSDEEVAVLTSRLTDARLADFVDDDDVDAETVVEIVQRVRESYADEARRETGKAVESKEREMSSAVETAQALANEQESIGRAATDRALKSEEEKRQLELRVTHNVSLIVGWIGRIGYWGLGVVVAGGIVMALPGFSVTSPFWARVVGGAILVVFVLLNFVDLHMGLSVAHLRKRFESYLSRRLTDWWLGPQ